MTLKTSALIIGGGPAGATAARYLSEAGVDNLLAERDLSYVKPCGGCIPSGGFVEFGLPETLIKRKISRIVIVAPSGKRLEFGLNGGQLFITERGFFDSALRSIAAQKGTWLIECELTGVERNNGSFVARLIRKSDKEIITVHSDYLLAADGISYKTGECLNIRRHEHLYTISTNVPGFEGDACEFWFGEKNASTFYSWLFPSDGRASIGTGGCSPGELHTLFDNFIKRRFGADSNTPSFNVNNIHPKIFPVPSWRGKPYSVGNALFLGDAAGMVMPTTYEGIYYAMKSGQLASQAIIEGAVDKYQEIMEDKFRYRFLLMNRLRKFFFRNDQAIERWVEMHDNFEIRELAMSLWLRKQTDTNILLTYLKACSGHLFL
jgi:geranylgeranyl diphosphate/geranylgeranyl-bacteriochlorophyllide a reductase